MSTAKSTTQHDAAQQAEYPNGFALLQVTPQQPVGRVVKQKCPDDYKKYFNTAFRQPVPGRPSGSADESAESSLSYYSVPNSDVAILSNTVPCQGSEAADYLRHSVAFTKAGWTPALESWQAEDWATEWNDEAPTSQLFPHGSQLQLDSMTPYLGSLAAHADDERPPQNFLLAIVVWAVLDAVARVRHRESESHAVRILINAEPELFIELLYACGHLLPDLMLRDLSFCTSAASAEIRACYREQTIVLGVHDPHDPLDTLDWITEQDGYVIDTFSADPLQGMFRTRGRTASYRDLAWIVGLVARAGTQAGWKLLQRMHRDFASSNQSLGDFREECRRNFLQPGFIELAQISDFSLWKRCWESLVRALENDVEDPYSRDAFLDILIEAHQSPERLAIRFRQQMYQDLEDLRERLNQMGGRPKHAVQTNLGSPLRLLLVTSQADWDQFDTVIQETFEYDSGAAERGEILGLSLVELASSNDDEKQALFKQLAASVVWHVDHSDPEFSRAFAQTLTGNILKKRGLILTELLDQCEESPLRLILSILHFAQADNQFLPEPTKARIRRALADHPGCWVELAQNDWPDELTHQVLQSSTLSNLLRLLEFETYRPMFRALINTLDHHLLLEGSAEYPLQARRFQLLKQLKRAPNVSIPHQDVLAIDEWELLRKRSRTSIPAWEWIVERRQMSVLIGVVAAGVCIALGWFLHALKFSAPPPPPATPSEVVGWMIETRASAQSGLRSTPLEWSQQADTRNLATFEHTPSLARCSPETLSSKNRSRGQPPDHTPRQPIRQELDVSDGHQYADVTRCC